MSCREDDPTPERIHNNLQTNKHWQPLPVLFTKSRNGNLAFRFCYPATARSLSVAQQTSHVTWLSYALKPRPVHVNCCMKGCCIRGLYHSISNHALMRIRALRFGAQHLCRYNQWRVSASSHQILDRHISSKPKISRKEKVVALYVHVCNAIL